MRAAAAAGAIDGILERMWNDMDDMPGQESGRAPTGDAIDDGIVIRMSDPQGSTECYWIAILEREDHPRYFTLEKSVMTPAVICEWTDEAHESAAIASTALTSVVPASIRCTPRAADMLPDR